MSPVMVKKMTEIEQRLGRRILQARQDAGLTQDQLGEQLGVTGATISRWESGDHQIHAGEIVRIARALRRPVAWFYDEPGESAHLVAGYHIERMTPENRRLMEQLADRLIKSQREPPPAE